MENNSRFKIEGETVTDLYSERRFCLADLPEDYMSAKYEAGFIQPAAFIDGKIILEETDAGYLRITEVLDESEALDKMLPLCSALAFMHEKGRVYGNLSPDTILDTENGYQIDSFGIGETPTKKNDYSAYEYYAYQGKGCPASDVYSVAGILYELLTGIHLEPAEIRLDSETELEPLVAFGVSDATESVIMKALQIFADDRYENMTEFMTALYGEKRVENFQNDWRIEIRKIRTEDENIEDKLKKTGTHGYEEDEQKVQEYEDDDLPRQKNKMPVILGLSACGLLLVGILAMAFMQKPAEKDDKPVRQIETEAVKVQDITPDYENVSPAGAAVSSGSAVQPEETPVPTKQPEKTPVPTKEPVKTPAPTKQPEKTPVPTKKPKKTPAPTKKPVKKKPKSKPKPTPEPVEEPVSKPATTPITKKQPGKKPGLTLDKGGDFTLNK